MEKINGVEYLLESRIIGRVGEGSTMEKNWKKEALVNLNNWRLKNGLEDFEEENDMASGNQTFQD